MRWKSALTETDFEEEIILQLQVFAKKVNNKLKTAQIYHHMLHDKFAHFV